MERSTNINRLQRIYTLPYAEHKDVPLYIASRSYRARPAGWVRTSKKSFVSIKNIHSNHSSCLHPVPNWSRYERLAVHPFLILSFPSREDTIRLDIRLINQATAIDINRRILCTIDLHTQIMSIDHEHDRRRNTGCCESRLHRCNKKVPTLSPTSTWNNPIVARESGWLDIGNTLYMSLRLPISKSL